jgi:ribosomal small subunit protein bTHX
MAPESIETLRPYRRKVSRTFQIKVFTYICDLQKQEIKALIIMGKGDLRSKKGKRVRKSFGVLRPRTAKGIGAFTPLSARRTAAESTASVAEKPAKKAKAKEATKKTTPVAKKATAKASANNLTKIEGIGPKLSSVLMEAGVDSYATLSTTDVEKLREILVSAGSRYKMFDPSTWPEQAALAAAEKWDDLKTLQDSLDGGKKK